MRAWIDVAILAKSRISKGRFVVRATAGLPFILQPGDEVAFVPPKTDVPRRAVVESVRMSDDVAAEVSFEGISEPDIVQELVGCHCLVRRSLIDEDVYESAPGTWEGWKVVDGEAGEVGIVVGVAENPAHPLLEVERADGAITLVPVVDEIVISVDVESRTVRISAPHGLLDL